MFESGHSHAIVAFIVVTIMVIALVAAVYYFYELSNGRMPTTSQLQWLKYFVVFALILGVILWIAMIFMFFRHHHHDVTDHFTHDEMYYPGTVSNTFQEGMYPS